MRLLKWFVEFISSVKIFAAPFLVSLILAFIYRAYDKSHAGGFITAGIVLLGAVIGVLITYRISKRKRASDFISELNRFPEGD